MIRYFGDVQKAAHVIMLSGGLGALVVVSHGFFESLHLLWFLGHIVPYFFHLVYQYLSL